MNKLWVCSMVSIRFDRLHLMTMTNSLPDERSAEDAALDQAYKSWPQNLGYHSHFVIVSELVPMLESFDCQELVNSQDLIFGPAKSSLELWLAKTMAAMLRGTAYPHRKAYRHEERLIEWMIDHNYLTVKDGKLREVIEPGEPFLSDRYNDLLLEQYIKSYFGEEENPSVKGLFNRISTKIAGMIKSGILRPKDDGNIVITD